MTMSAKSCFLSNLSGPESGAGKIQLIYIYYKMDGKYYKMKWYTIFTVYSMLTCSVLRLHMTYFSKYSTLRDFFKKEKL